MEDQKKLIKIKLSDIVFDEGIYPRTSGHDPSRVQEYAKDMEQIEASQKFISINADKKLLDGRHRMLAYKKNAESDMNFEVSAWQYPISSPLESFKIACAIQDKGKSLESQDKEAAAKKFYGMGLMNQKEIAAQLSVSPGRVSQWLSKTINDEKERNKKKVFDMWLACETQEKMAEVVNVTQKTIDNWIEDFSKSLNPKDLLKINFQEDFQLPIYNIWNFGKKTNETAHPGNTEVRIVDNLLYLYTKPFDIVFDPFGGGGATIDICKKRYRRYWVSDLNPIVEREHEIRKLDISKELPLFNNRWPDVKLTYLDPPYWKQVEGKYSNSPDDLANMSLQDFNEALSGIVNRIAEKQSNGYIALIIQPTQWKAENREIVDHVFDMVKLCDNKKLKLETRISCPYATEQYTPQMVEWAKENKKLLVLTRELIVWRLQ